MNTITKLNPINYFYFTFYEVTERSQFQKKLFLNSKFRSMKSPKLVQLFCWIKSVLSIKLKTNNLCSSAHTILNVYKAVGNTFSSLHPYMLLVRKNRIIEKEIFIEGKGLLICLHCHSAFVQYLVLHRAFFLHPLLSWFF